MPDNSGAVDLGALSTEEQEAVQRLAEQQPDASPQREVLTAFIVLVDPDGNPEVAGFSDPALNVLQPPNNDLVFSACQTIIKDLQVAETANAVVGAMMQQTQALAERQQQALIQQQLAREGGVRRG